MNMLDFQVNIYRKRSVKASLLLTAGFVLMFVSVYIFIGLDIFNVSLAFVMVLLSAAGLAASVSGGFIYGRNSRAAAYLSAMEGRNCISFEELGGRLAFSVSFIHKDLTEIISLGLIPTGRITPDGKFFKIGSLEGEELIDTGSETLHTAAGDADFIDEGRSYIKRLERINASLYPNKFLAPSLEKAAYSSEVFFKYMETCPGKMPAVRIDVNANLRRAIKFIDEYKELARFSIDNRRINELKSGAVEYLDNAARDFDRLYSALKEPEENAGLEGHISGDTVKDFIKAGRAYTRRIRRANESLPDEAVSEKLNKMEALMKNIFDYIELHPEKAPEIKKLMNRHLPMILKLIESYGKFEKLGVRDSGAASLKDEIIGAIDTVNGAFKSLLSKLARGTVLDISTDIDVLKAVLTQDGLISGDDFKLKGK